MKKNVIALVLGILLITIIVFIIIFVNKIGKSSIIVPSKEEIPRLQGYSFKNFGQPKKGFNFNENNSENPNIHQWIFDTFMKGYKFHKNVKFVSSEKLTYFSQNNNYVIRGIVQVKLENGTIEEQDVEYAFNKSANFGEEPRLCFVGLRNLGDKRLVKGSD